MAAVNYQRLIKLHEQLGPVRAKETLGEMFGAKDIAPDDVDISRLFCECFGFGAFDDCRRGRREGWQVLREAGGEGAVSTASFYNITGQIVYNATIDKYKSEPPVFTSLIPEVQTQFLLGEKIAGITQIGDQAAIRPEGDAYALVGVGENWIQTPPIVDRGMIIPLTWEAVFQDRTGQLLERAREVGDWLRVQLEKRAIDCIIDENTTVHRYKWRGTTIASYGDNSGSHSWDNLAASNGLVDWTDIDTAEQVFNALTDPFTGEPIDVEARHIVHVKALQQTVHHIFNATTIARTVPGYATTANPTQTMVTNPYNSKYTSVTSRLLAARLATDTDWFLGDISRYAKRMVAERPNVVEAPPNNEQDFHRRIVNQWRANERSEYVVVEPRAIVKSTA